MASVVVSDATERKIKSVLPDWLKTEPGFRFVDNEGDTYIVLGFGGWRKDEPMGHASMLKGDTFQLTTLIFMPPTLVGAMLYKGEFSIIDIVAMEGLNECKPLQLGGD